MYNLLKCLSIVLQCFLLLAIFNFFSGVYSAYLELSSGDPKLIAGHISSGLVLSLIQIIPALIGLFLSIWLLAKNNNSNLFKIGCKSLAYVWLLFVPLGTFLGVKQLKRLKNT
ncbi:hypothetical protein [Thalassotalea ganghwensis]